MSWEIIGLIGLEICLWPWHMHKASEKGQSSTQCFFRHAEARHLRESFSWRLLSVGPKLEVSCRVAHTLFVWIFALSEQLCCGSWAEKGHGLAVRAPSSGFLLKGRILQHHVQPSRRRVWPGLICVDTAGLCLNVPSAFFGRLYKLISLQSSHHTEALSSQSLSILNIWLPGSFGDHIIFSYFSW